MNLEATLDVTVRDDDVVFDVRVENDGDAPVELTFSTGQTADVTVYESDSIDENGGGLEDSEPVWRWSDGRMFTQAIREGTLQPGEEIREQFTWENPPAGEYVARGTLSADKSAEADAMFVV